MLWLTFLLSIDLLHPSLAANRGLFPTPRPKARGFGLLVFSLSWVWCGCAQWTNTRFNYLRGMLIFSDAPGFTQARCTRRVSEGGKRILAFWGYMKGLPEKEKNKLYQWQWRATIRRPIGNRRRASKTKTAAGPFAGFCVRSSPAQKVPVSGYGCACVIFFWLRIWCDVVQRYSHLYLLLFFRMRIGFPV